MAGEWAFPVAGANDWNRGSWMPDTLTHRGRTHAAIDVYAKRGSAVVAPVAGVVIAVGIDTAVGGNWVQYRGDDGITYYFAHMDRPSGVRKGQRVSAKSYLGAVGNSGSASSTSPHLHFSMKFRGQPVNPVNWFERGTQLDPAQYDHFQYDDAFNASATDPFFVGGPGSTQPETAPIRDTVAQMLEAISNSVAGGQRSGLVSDDVTDLTQPGGDGLELPTVEEEGIAP